jgi:3-oxoacyl-[acyl-carrier-protein] synthase III
MWSTPGYILRELGAKKARAAEIRNGCNGLLTAMELAATMISAKESGNMSVLLTTADNFNSPVIDRWAASPLGTIAADAASAAVITREPGFARLESIVSRHFPELEALQRGDEPLFPPTGSSGRAIDVVERANSFTQKLPDPASISDALAAALSEAADAALADAGLTTADMRWVICNNTSKWTLERLFLEPLGVPLAKSTWDYGCTVGHAGASDHILSLEHLLRRGELDRGDRVLLVGGAPGWMAASTVLTIEEVPSW